MSSRVSSARAYRARRGFLGLFRALLSLRAQRVRLAELEPHILRDIGLTPEEAAAEASRPFWDAPAAWRR